MTLSKWSLLLLSGLALAACSEIASVEGPDAGTSIASQDAGPVDAGPTPGKCVPACSGERPTCDFSTGTCIVCTATRGCESRETPYCDTTAQGGRCVGCLRDDQCAGSTCDTARGACRATADGGTPGGETPDAGTPDAGTPACAPTLECNPPCDPNDTCIAGLCRPRVGCATECERGFSCVQGQCTLNGGGGPIQVTLRWKGDTDVDLHLVHPDSFETYYGETNEPGNPSYDPNHGSLDLDSNAGCTIDSINIENVIFDAAGTPPGGTYKVLVDYYDHCNVSAAIPFEVIARVNGVEQGYCGQFVARDADQGAAGAGRQVMTFTY